MTRKVCTFTVALVTMVSSLVALTWAQAPAGGFSQFWGPLYSYPAPDVGARRLPPRPTLVARTRCITGTASRSIPRGSTTRRSLKVTRESSASSSGRAARAGRWPSCTSRSSTPSTPSRSATAATPAYPTRPSGASIDAAIAQAAHDTLVAMYPSQKAHCDQLLAEELAKIRDGRAKSERHPGRSARRARHPAAPRR